MACKSLAFLNVTMPDNEMVKPNSSIRRAKSADAVKQYRYGKGNFQIHSVRIWAVSASASRVWTISGKPV